MSRTSLLLASLPVALSGLTTPLGPHLVDGCELDKHSWQPDPGTHKMISGGRPSLLHVPPVSKAYRAMNHAVVDEGNPIADFADRKYSLQECVAKCNNVTNCTSFAYSEAYGSCHLKDKCVTGVEPVKHGAIFRTYYKACTSKPPLWVLAPAANQTPSEFLEISGLGTFAMYNYLTYVVLEGLGEPDDVEYVRGVLSHVLSTVCIDRDRISCIGFSEGASFCSRLASELPEYVASVAAVAGIRYPSPNNATRPVPILAFHGTADPVLPYDGSDAAGWRTSVESAMDQWATRNGCKRHRWQETHSRSVFLGRNIYCRGNADVTLYKVDGGGHTWPGSPYDFPEKKYGSKNAEIDANKIIARFIHEYPRRVVDPGFECSCTYGTPVTGLSCVSKGEEKCSSCHPGFPQVRDTCGTTRLSGGTRGTLEVYEDGRWGPVCDDGFDAEAAREVCRELGLSGGRVLVGTGSRVTASKAWGLSGCSTSRAAQAECAPTTTLGLEFVVGNDGADRCPHRTMELTRDECALMPKHFGGMLHKPFAIHTAFDPKGCFRFGRGGLYYYNSHPTGAGHVGRTLYCKAVHDLQYVVGGENGCSEGSVGLTRNECANIPSWFGGALHQPLEVGSGSGPRHCVRDGSPGVYRYCEHGSGQCPGRPYCKLEYKVEYVLGESGGSGCSYHLKKLSEAECRGIPLEFGVGLREPFVIDSADEPSGCFGRDGVAAFNRHATGTGQPGSVVYCGRPQEVGYIIGNDGANACPFGSLALTAAQCHGLPGQFGGGLLRPDFVIRDAEQPRGCFRSRASGTFSYNRHPEGGERIGSVPHCRISYALEYVVGTEGEPTCPEGTSSLSEDECKAAPKWRGGALHQPFVIGRANWPRGCIVSDGDLFFNVDSTGSNHLGAAPLCKRGREKTVAYAVGDDGDDGCPAGTSTLSEEECREVIHWFTGGLANPFAVASTDLPRGCYLAGQLFRYNTMDKGSNRKGATVYCKLRSPVAYTVGGNGKSQCPPGMVALSSTECRGLPMQYGGELASPFIVSDHSAPVGCIESKDDDRTQYFFNKAHSGTGRRGLTPYCKQKGEAQWVV